MIIPREGEHEVNTAKEMKNHHFRALLSSRTAYCLVVSMIVVAAMLKAVDGKGDDLEKEFRKLVPKVLNDPGAISYVVHRNIDDVSKFFVYEKYESRDALKYHSSTEHFKEFSRAIAALLSGRPEVGLYSEVT